MADCDKYLIDINKWVRLPNLHGNRKLVTTFSFQNAYIYGCYGHNGLRFTNKIERLSIYRPNDWAQMEFKRDACGLNCSMHAL